MCVRVCIQYIFACLCVSEVIRKSEVNLRYQTSASPLLEAGSLWCLLLFLPCGSHTSFQSLPSYCALSSVQLLHGFGNLNKSQACMKWIHSSLSTKNKPFTLSLIICMPVCRYVHAGAGAHSGQKETLDCLELESQALWVIRHGCWVLLKNSMCS